MTTATTEHATIAPATTTLPRGAIDIGTPPAASSGSSIWTATRVIALGLTVIETLLLARFALLLLGANASQGLVAFVYGITDPLVRPFQGIFGQPEGPPMVEVAAILAVLFFLLVGALVVAVVRAATGRRAGPQMSVMSDAGLLVAALLSMVLTAGAILRDTRRRLSLSRSAPPK